MSNSTSTIDNLIASQAGKEITANAFFDAASPATLYGRRASTTAGLVFGYYGGVIAPSGVPILIPNGVLTLTASSTVYIEAAQDTGVVYQNNAGFTPGRIPLYIVVTNGAAAPTWTDVRSLIVPSCQAGTLDISGDSAFQYDLSNCKIATLTGSPSAAFSVLIPARPWEFTIRNATGQTATFSCGATNTVAIAAGMIAKIMTDGTDVHRVTADI